MTRAFSRRPDDVLRRIGAGGTRATVERILRVWARHTDADLESGARWYGADAEALLGALVDAGAPSREHAAAVVAHLSPRTTWQRNTLGAVLLITRGEAAARRAGCLSRNVENAAHALTVLNPLDTLNGPKTARFARNLMGDREAVTVDVWAARVAFGDVIADPERALSSVGAYAATEHAFRLAARRAAVDPTTMQATTWIVARNGRAA